MVDTLAPKKIYSQRELDTRLTPSPVAQQILQPNKPIGSTGKAQASTMPLVNTAEKDYLVDVNKIFAQQVENSAPVTAERVQTKKSSNELINQKQTGDVVNRDVGQGLVSRPIEYAEHGFEDSVIDRPVVVGEKGMEMIVPTGKGKFSVINNDALQGLMSKLNSEQESRQATKDEGSQMLLAEVESPNKKFSFKDFKNRPIEEQKEIFKQMFKMFEVPDIDEEEDY
jgi:hypothetical protein|tara:strand:+ start:135 stop:812 length:678 start_codon:yes stop_codon:yes gene_type:complete